VVRNAADIPTKESYPKFIETSLSKHKRIDSLISLVFLTLDNYFLGNIVRGVIIIFAYVIFVKISLLDLACFGCVCFYLQQSLMRIL